MTDEDFAEIERRKWVEWAEYQRIKWYLKGYKDAQNKVKLNKEDQIRMNMEA